MSRFRRNMLALCIQGHHRNPCNRRIRTCHAIACPPTCHSTRVKTAFVCVTASCSHWRSRLESCESISTQYACSMHPWSSSESIQSSYLDLPCNRLPPNTPLNKSENRLCMCHSCSHWRSRLESCELISTQYDCSMHPGTSSESMHKSYLDLPCNRLSPNTPLNKSENRLCMCHSCSHWRSRL